MITRAHLLDWNNITFVRQTNQAVIDAFECIRDEGYALDPEISYSEFYAAVDHLQRSMPSSIATGWMIEMKSELLTHALQVFDRDSMANDIDAFADLFSKTNEDFRLQRDTQRWNVNGFERMMAIFAKNIDIMPARSYGKFLTNAMSYTLRQCDGGVQLIDREVFFDKSLGFKNYSKVFIDQGLKAVIGSAFKTGIGSKVFENNARIEECVLAAQRFKAIHEAQIKIPVFQMDVLLMTQLVERMINAYAHANRPEDKQALAEGVVAAVEVCFRPDEAVPKVGDNCFRPHHCPKNWQVWMDPVPLQVLTSNLVDTLDQFHVTDNDRIASAIKKLSLQLLIDGTVCAQSMGVKEGVERTEHHTKCANLIGNFVRALIPTCEPFLTEPGAMKGLSPKARITLIGLLPHGEAKRSLLMANKRDKAQVLMDNLGL